LTKPFGEVRLVKGIRGSGLARWRAQLVRRTERGLFNASSKNVEGGKDKTFCNDGNQVALLPLIYKF
jgi:hypothetical protein